MPIQSAGTQCCRSAVTPEPQRDRYREAARDAVDLPLPRLGAAGRSTTPQNATIDQARKEAERKRRAAERARA